MAELTIDSSSNYHGRGLRLELSQAIDIANNKSTITWTLTSSGGTAVNYSTGPTTVIIDGDTVYSQARVDSGFPASTGSTSGTLEVTHNTDGTKAISVSLTTAVYYFASQTDSESWQLDSIPRGATITSANNFNDEATSITVGYSNPAGYSATSVEIGVFSEDGNTALIGYRSVARASTSASITITNAERTALQNYINWGTTRKVAYKIKTVIGGNTFYGDLVKKTLSLINYEPRAQAQLGDFHATTQHYINNSQRFFEGLNQIDYEIDAQGQKGATIKDYWVRCGSQEVTGYVGRFNNVNSGEFYFTVVDSRGNITSWTERLTMLPYVPVSCKQDVSIELEGETTAQVNVVASGNYIDNVDVQDGNSLTVFYRIKEGNGNYSGYNFTNGTRTLDINNNTYKEEFVIDGLDYTKTYTIQCWAYDYFTQEESAPYTITLRPVFDWSDTDFNFNVPVTIQGATIADVVVEQGTKTTGSGNAAANWVYRKWSSGIAECWCRKHISTAVNTAWGNLYVSGALSYTNIDWGVTFTEIPVANITIAPNNSGAFLIAGGSTSLTATKTGGYEIARGSALTSSGNFYINYYAIGRWK